MKAKATCSNCGAHYHGYRCLYCGTEYEPDETDQDVLEAIDALEAMGQAFSASIRAAIGRQP